jgi:hypothetical protein
MKDNFIWIRICELVCLVVFVVLVGIAMLFGGME